MIAAISDLIAQVVVYTTIYALVALGIVISGRTGIFNISGEGVMLVSASIGYMTAISTQNWVLGFAFAAVVGGIFGLVLIIIHEKLGVDQFILGIALIILGSALADLSYKIVFAAQLQIARAPSITHISIPLLSSVPIIGGFFDQNVVTYFMYVATFSTYRFFYGTKRGIEVRAIGENPRAADVVGIRVREYRVLASIIGGMFMGIGGAYLPMAITGSYSYQMTAGRGFMAIGIAIFASWKPQRVFISSFIFSIFEVLAPRLELFFPEMPYQFFLMLPFVGVLFIMAIFKKHIEFPAALGEPYSRE
jgi:simple sugar transport system permease protein